MGSELIYRIRAHPVIFIFLLAVFIRIVLVFVFPLPDQSGGDFPLYSRIAESLVAQGDFGGEPQKTYGSPYISPGFAFYLAFLYLLFGKSIIVLISASILLGGLIAVGVYFLAFCIFTDKKVAFIAGMTAALWPTFLIQTFSFGNSLLLYTALLLFSILFFIKAIFEKKIIFAIFSGAILGFAALTEPIAFYIPLVFLIWTAALFLFRKTISNFEFRLKFLATIFSLFLITFIAIIAPWGYRNTLVSNTELNKIPVISKGELQLLTPEYLGKLATPFFSRLDILVFGLEKMFIFPYNISSLDHDKVFSYKKVAMNFVSGASVELSGRQTIVFMTKILFTLLYWILLGLGFWGMARYNSKYLNLLTILLLGYIVVASIGYGSLGDNNFENIALLSSFFFVLLPFFIIFASKLLIEEKDRMYSCILNTKK